MKAQIQKFVFHFGFLASRFLLGVFASLSFVLFPVRAELQQAEKVRILRGNTGEIDEVQSLTSIDGFENFVNALERAEVGDQGAGIIPGLGQPGPDRE